MVSCCSVVLLKMGSIGFSTEMPTLGPSSPSLPPVSLTRCTILVDVELVAVSFLLESVCEYSLRSLCDNWCVIRSDIGRVVLFGPVADRSRKREIAVSAITCFCCLWPDPEEYHGVQRFRGNKRCRTYTEPQSE